MQPFTFTRSRVLAILAMLAMAVSANAGALGGPILDVGTTAVPQDFETIPPSSGSRPLARINVTRESPDGTGRLFGGELNGPLQVIDAGGLATYMDLLILRRNFRSRTGPNRT